MFMYPFLAQLAIYQNERIDTGEEMELELDSR
jgi:hypothetical protein